MQAAAHNGKYGIVRQAGMELVKIHHDLENEKQPQPMAQKSAPPLDYQQFPSKPLYFPHCFRLFPSTSSPLPPLGHSQPAPQSASPLNSQQFPPNPLSSPFCLAQKCAPTPPQVQNPALKCARPFLSGFKMRAACAPRCANFTKNPISSPKTQKTPFPTVRTDKNASKENKNMPKILAAAVGGGLADEESPGLTNGFYYGQAAATGQILLRVSGRGHSPDCSNFLQVRCKGRWCRPG